MKGEGERNCLHVGERNSFHQRETVTHPGTSAHNCSLNSSIDHTTIYALGHWYSNVLNEGERNSYHGGRVTDCMGREQI